MAYDLHIVRTKDWTEAASAPITKQDVDSLIAVDSALAWSTTDYVDMADQAGVSTRYYMMRGEASRAFGGIEIRFNVPAQTRRRCPSSCRCHESCTRTWSATMARFTRWTGSLHGQNRRPRGRRQPGGRFGNSCSRLSCWAAFSSL